jgi:subtilase family serine protease
MKYDTLVYPPITILNSIRILIGLSLFSCIGTHAANMVAVNSDIPTALSTSIVTGHADANKMINLVLSFNLKHPKEATDYAMRVSTPGDPLLGKFLTPEQFGEKFGPSVDDYNKVLKWATTQGLTVIQQSKSHTSMVVRGTVNKLESALQTQINNYKTPINGKTFFAATTAAKLPSDIANVVGSVTGLDDYVQYAPFVKWHRLPNKQEQPKVGTYSSGGTGPDGSYSAEDLRKAYNVPPHLSVPKQTTVALFQQGGFNQSNIDTYLKENKLPNIPIHPIGVNGFDVTTVYPAIEPEVVLDIDMVIAMNPQVKAINVYEDGRNPFLDGFKVALLSVLDRVANDNSSQVLSISYGADENQMGSTQMDAENVRFTQLAAQGVTVFASSGDYGAFGAHATSDTTLKVTDPSSQPFVTSAGGTTLFTDPLGNRLDEQVWNTLMNAGKGATGGGASAHWTIPKYQLDKNFKPYTTANGGSGTMRNIPDLAAVADGNTGPGIYVKDSGGWIQVSGTSISSPIWAGYISVVNDVKHAFKLGNIGFLNPALPNLTKIKPPHSGIYFNSPMYDIQYGYNGFSNKKGYSAGIGYDDCTGWGSMEGTQLVYSYFSIPNSKNVCPPAAPRNLRGAGKGTTINLSWTPVIGAAGYLVYGQTDNGSFTMNDTTPKACAVFGGLQPNTSYFFFVMAANAGGTGEWSPMIKLSTGKDSQVIRK